MGENRTSDRVNSYVPSLEGVRGYGFLLVFCGHYFLPFQLADPGTVKYGIFVSLTSLAAFAVPAFFVLSGYLIGGILYDARNREGYFRVFYTRRILRLFPVYYLALLAIYVFYKLHGIVPGYRFWAHFFYIQNLLPGYFASAQDGPVGMLHLWSLAVEEQFYLFWPVVVWFFPDRRKLIKIASGFVLCGVALRALAPLVATDVRQYAYFTPVRVDAILLGVVLALIRDGRTYRRLEPIAKWVLLGAVGMAITLVAWKGREWGGSAFWREEISILLPDIVGVAAVIAVQERNSLLHRACSLSWACWLGGLSYSAYVFHVTFAPFFFHVVAVRLSAHIRPHFAVIISGLLALCLTLLLSVLSKICIEGPIMNLKRNLRYGPEMPVNARSAGSKEQEILVSNVA
jgi:peptidoglycan/LPS O-acetylase OafA/YrhL